jgi:hypothetical protein
MSAPSPRNPIQIPGLGHVEPGSADDARLGALLGLAVGDALGTTYELERLEQPPSPTRDRPATDIVGGGPFDLAPGQITDDTLMAIGIARSLLTSTPLATAPTSLAATPTSLATGPGAGNRWRRCRHQRRDRRRARRCARRRRGDSGGVGRARARGDTARTRGLGKRASSTPPRRAGDSAGDRAAVSRRRAMLAA